jgi:hypothetical protein
MFLDAHILLWDATALSSDAASTNTYDSTAAGNDLTNGEGLVVVIQVDVAADFTTGDETYEFQFIQSANANLSSPDILASRTIAAASLTAGSLHYIPVPPASKTKRYLGLFFNGGGTSPTITVTAFITTAQMLQTNKAYPDAFDIT